MNSHTDLLFRLCPYAAVAVLVLGLILRYLRALPRMDAVTADLAQSWATFGSGKVLGGVLGLLAAAHIVALIPGSLLLLGGSQDRLMILEVGGMLVSVVALGGWLRLIMKHLQEHHPSFLGDLGDSVFMGLVLVGLATGLGTAVVYRWASAWSAVTLMPYVQSLFSGAPTAEYAAEMPFLVQLHVCSGFAALAMLPFTRLAQFAVVGMHRTFIVVGRPLAAAGKMGEEWLRRHNPGVWIWPKEE
jgi:nitrate reductase gamma subunit